MSSTVASLVYKVAIKKQQGMDTACIPLISSFKACSMTLS